MRKAVLFDLDDTIFDHQYCRRAALRKLAGQYSVLAQREPAELETLHEKHLQNTHTLLLDGKISIAQARLQRMRLLFTELGAELDLDSLEAASQLFRNAYEESLRPVPGAVPLIRELKRRAKVGVITNGLSATQRSKIACCGLESQIDALVISGEAGVRKPDRRIFEMALAMIGCLPEDAIMVGDSWLHDVLGARAAGIAAVWLNRYGERNPEPGKVIEVNRLEPLERLLELLIA